jgi:hypothetical protein
MMRDAAIRCLREIGVDTGGSNVQFAVDPQNGRMVIIEMNPRVSRSSALASKATGFPIAKIAARLAVGYRLDEMANDITRKTPACFEPTLDYVVAKIGRRGDGHRAHLQGSALERNAQPGNGQSVWIGEIRQGSHRPKAHYAHAGPAELHPFRDGQWPQRRGDSRAYCN